jgi:hypothetical protein
MLFSLGSACVGLCLVVFKELYATWWAGGKSQSAVVKDGSSLPHVVHLE